MEVATRPKGARGGAAELNIDSMKTALFTLGSFCNYPQCNQLLRVQGLAEVLRRRRLPDDPDIRKQSLRILVKAFATFPERSVHQQDCPAFLATKPSFCIMMSPCCTKGMVIWKSCRTVGHIFQAFSSAPYASPEDISRLTMLCMLMQSKMSAA